MTRAELIAVVNKKTENALVGQLDFNQLFLDVAQEFCGEHRFWWRKKRFTLATAAGTALYDLTDTAGVVTTPQNIGPFAEEISFVGLVNGTQIDKLDPIFDDQAVSEWSLDSSQDRPGVWTIDTSNLTNSQTLRLHKTPNAIYTLHVSAWMMPNAVSDSADETIYIVPPTWHHVLQIGMEREVWRLKYGEEDPKFGTAEKLYEKKVQAAIEQPSFSTERQVEFRRNDGRAVRSTR